jgi:hypothetical protein
VPNVERAIDELAGIDRGERARPAPLQEAPGGEQELREPADPNPAHGGRGRALRREPLPLPRASRSRRASSVLSAGRGRLPRHRLHRAHQRRRREAHRPGRPHRQLQGHGPHRQARASRAPTRRSCTARPGSEQVEIDAGGRAIRSLARASRYRATTSW